MRGMSLAHTSRVDGEGEDIKFKSFAPVENFAWQAQENGSGTHGS